MDNKQLSDRYVNLLFLFFFVVSLFLGFNKHSKDTFNTYKSVLWADASGYYVHLPIWFIYGNNAAQITDTLVKQTGQGFHVDREKNKIITKYTCGTAILQMPFFFAAHLNAGIIGKKQDGFSSVYQLWIIVAAAFYGWLGLWLLFRFLSGYFSKNVALITVLFFFLCTNLYYYMLDSSGMSHIYSFFLFSCIVFCTDHFIRKPGLLPLLFLFCSLVFAILIRPTNVIMFLFPLFFNVRSMEDVKIRVKLFFSNPVYLFISLGVSVLILLPQLFYWSQTFGKWIVYSYGEEGFLNWSSPKILEVWFSANNSLFVYTPLFLLSVTGIVLMMKRKQVNAVFFLAIFLGISYIFASWWDWGFGCAYGARSFIEYYVIFSVPLAYLLASLKTPSAKIAVGVFIAVCCFLNFDIIYYYDGCCYAATWEYEKYFELLK